MIVGSYIYIGARSAWSDTEKSRPKKYVPRNKNEEILNICLECTAGAKCNGNCALYKQKRREILERNAEEACGKSEEPEDVTFKDCN